MEKADEYRKKVKLHSPGSKVIKNSLKAFFFGGTICLFGELLAELYIFLGLSEKTSYMLVTVSLIFIAALLTGVGLFDKIARHAGAGTLVPVTGFANAVVSPAIDTKSEGLILGVGAKIFTVAGPVILYATLSGTLFGIIYYITGLFI
ncbi:MAG: stage V sporulation protein AC [Ruminococcaceae bacterium]|nr:stage V sporulation protein AC [Oscillospiraceae bacterium]